jgi:hypothetical protein
VVAFFLPLFACLSFWGSFVDVGSVLGDKGGMLFLRSLLCLVLIFVGGVSRGQGYDPGPDPSDLGVRALVDLMAEVPPLPEFNGPFGLGGFFRKDWGPTFLGVQGLGSDGTVWGHNAVEVLVVGQDGVPLAEAAGRLGVSRFAGFSWSLARYFGYSKVGFVNAFPYGVNGMYTVKGCGAQYTTRDGRRVGVKLNFVEAPLWYVGMDARGPLVPWRDRFYDWVLERNSGSLSLVLLFGEAARDAFGGYLSRRGVEVPLRFGLETHVKIEGGRAVLDPAQLGGYRLEGLRYGGRFSLQGLKVGGSVLANPVYVVYLPHHSHLSRSIGGDEAVLRRGLDYQTRLLAQEGFQGAAGSPFSRGEHYRYLRDERTQESLSEFFDFGMPKNRYGFQGLASRRGEEPKALALGLLADGGEEGLVGPIRERPVFGPPPLSYSLGRPVGEDRWVWERGPQSEWGQLFSQAEAADLFEEKPEGGYRLGVGPSVGLFGHYRGDLVSPRVVVLADPLGFDDMMTSRALTGLRGQYLQGLMEFLGFGERYLVVKTVPASMEGVSEEDWLWVLARLEGYHRAVVSKVEERFGKVVWVADGLRAKQVLDRLGVPCVELSRTGDFSADMAAAASGIPGGRQVSERGVLGPRPIPRSHLPFFSRFWEGAAGDSVVAEAGVDPWRRFFMVLPQGVVSQEDLEGVLPWHQRYEGLLREAQGAAQD